MRGQTVVAASVTALTLAGVAASPGAAAQSPYATAVENTAGVVSSWRLDETGGASAADSTGQHPGSYLGGGGVTLGSPGLIASDSDAAAGFTTGGVSIPRSATLQPGAQVSIEAWVKPATTDIN